MHKNHKTGFTLVELMVVIVIMGILAGVAIPKLTNSVTKAKASEVAPAANTYIKLQNAYVMEKKRIGSWRKIGYTKPKSDVFTYDKADISTGKSVADLGESGLVGWKATNKAPLGGCTSNNEWTVTILNKGADSDGNIQLEYKSDVSSSECAAISGDWGVVGGNTEVASASNKTLNSLGTKIFGDNSNSSSTMDLAKAIVSGKSSTNSDGLANSFNEQYHIDNFVMNQGASAIKLGDGTTLSQWLKKQVDPDGTTKLRTDDRVNVVTVFEDQEVAFASGVRYKATQTFYYDATHAGNLVNLETYGTRDVWVEKTSDGYKYYDADGNELAYTEGWDTESKDSESFELPIVDWNLDNYASPITKSLAKAANTDASGKTTLTRAISESFSSVNANTGPDSKKWIYPANYPDGEKVSLKDAYGIEGYLLNDDASTNIDLKTMTGTSGRVKVVTELHADVTELTIGTVYVGTQVLYYGAQANGFSVYKTKKVYAVATEKNKVIYYSDPECKKSIDPKTTGYWQSNEGDVSSSP